MTQLKKVIVTKNVEGNGRDPQNSAVFATRFKFPKELWRFGGKDEELAIEEAGLEYKTILNIPGLVSAQSFSTTSSYDLWVRKATAYDWDEIEPRIIWLLEQRHDRLTAEATEVVEVAN